MAEIVPVVSETLEAQVRNLLPSQRGFGEDLQASNVIMPIIDLTAAAEGTSVPQYQSQAIAFGSQTAFAVRNQTTVIANTPGFYRVIGTANITGSSSRAKIQMSDGLSTKDVWQMANDSTDTSSQQIDLIFFLTSGDSLSLNSNTVDCFIDGSVRQVADVNGNVVNPVGFTPQ